ncbi:MAG TPA: hypothetical protein DDX98_13965 [Bacteroidales bacterium]|jgi:protein-S-isoprenylcysteine O-methyltransferase Ste14|nr:hypothetical protein [Bacteroidales bacterium]
MLMKNRVRSVFHVLVQFASIIYLLFNVNIPDNLYLKVTLLSGIALGLWSIWEMRHSDLSIFPDPGKNIQLIIRGPYKYIRHPMYLALFVVLVPLVIFSFSWINLVVLVVFSINQVLKLFFEEKLIQQALPGYAAYMTKSWRLIPLLF